MGKYSVKEGLGELRENNFGSQMIIVKFNTTRDIDVYFPKYKWTYKNTNYGAFVNGTLTCPYEPRLYKHGYIGEGVYNSKDNKKCYDTWNKMLERCYGEKYQKIHPTYKDCEVCDDWLNFQTFAKWYYLNYYICDGDRMCLDKDILYKNNKVYSPDNCIFVPARINKLFTKRQQCRGESPIGTQIDKKCTNTIYIVTCHGCDNKMHYLGRYRSFDEAFNVYKEFKEHTIKNVAEQYKDNIPSKLYNALYNYVVEIND